MAVQQHYCRQNARFTDACRHILRLPASSPTHCWHHFSMVYILRCFFEYDGYDPPVAQSPTAAWDRR